MPISRITPMSAMIAEVGLEQHQREQRADARRGQRRQDRDRMHAALVQHAEHDVDGEERRENQQRLARQRCLERARVPWKLPRIVAGTPMRTSASSIASRRLRQRHASRQVERDASMRRTGPGGSRRAACWSARNARTRDSGTCAPVDGLHVDVVERLGRLPVFAARPPSRRGTG